MLLLNFTHPLSPAQLVQLAELTGQPVDRTLGEMVHFDPQAPLHPQILAIVDRLALDTTTWQTAPIDDGRWTMDDGRWTMDDGRWTMDGHATKRPNDKGAITHDQLLSRTSADWRLSDYAGGVGAGGTFGLFGGDLARGLWLVL